MAAQSISIGYVWFSIDGRVGRSVYWLWYFLPIFVINIVAPILDEIIGTLYMTSSGVPIGIIATAVGIFSLWPMIAVGAKRCHDRNRSGWYQLVYLIPFFGALWMFIYLGFLAGTEGSNRFGPDPLDDNKPLGSPELAQS